MHHTSFIAFVLLALLPITHAELSGPIWNGAVRLQEGIPFLKRAMGTYNNTTFGVSISTNISQIFNTTAQQVVIQQQHKLWGLTSTRSGAMNNLTASVPGFRGVVYQDRWGPCDLASAAPFGSKFNVTSWLFAAGSSQTLYLDIRASLFPTQIPNGGHESVPRYPTDYFTFVPKTADASYTIRISLTSANERTIPLGDRFSKLTIGCGSDAHTFDLERDSYQFHRSVLVPSGNVIIALEANATSAMFPDFVFSVAEIALDTESDQTVEIVGISVGSVVSCCLLVCLIVCCLFVFGPQKTVEYFLINNAD